jgi:hypothetical protein
MGDTATIAKTQQELQDMVNVLVDTGRKYGMEYTIVQVQDGKKYQHDMEINIENHK